MTILGDRNFFDQYLADFWQNMYMVKALDTASVRHF